MSDWNRSGRDDDQRRQQFDERDRRGFGARMRAGQDDWPSDMREGRSFDPDRDAYRGYPSYGGASRTARPDYWQSDYGGETAGYDEGYVYGYGQSGAPGYGGAAGAGRYGAPDYSRGYGSQPYGSRAYGGQGYRREDYARSAYARPAYDTRGAFEPRNEIVQRVTDGEVEHLWRHGHAMGEHRGRGPKNYTRSDDRIREDVSDRLSDDSWLDASEIEVTVSKGEVTLAGTVHSREDKRHAEDLADQVSSVRHVQNNLRVQAAGTSTMTHTTSAATASASRSNLS
jgi:osmotically-inducible protein OsmY